MGYVLAVPVAQDSDDTLLFEVDRSDVADDLVLASSDGSLVADRARVTLEAAIEQLKPSLRKIGNMLNDVAPDEAEIEFGLKIGGETGIIIAKGSVDVNFTVRLCWKKPELIVFAPSREGFVVAVRRTGTEAPVGVGFLVTERHIITCAHVINVALGRNQQAQDMPGPNITVEVTFPILGDAEGAPVRGCRVTKWVPPFQSELYGGDICCLVVVGEGIPSGAAPARLVGPSTMRDMAVDLFGYPGNPPRKRNGAWAEHRLRGAVGGGVIQLDADSESALRAQPGYSGSPVIVSDSDGDAVVGMLAVASNDPNAGDAYAIPVERLVEVWPEVLTDLTIPACPYRGLQVFTRDDSEALFVGREAQVEQLQKMVELYPLTMVVGPSGGG